MRKLKSFVLEERIRVFMDLGKLYILKQKCCGKEHAWLLGANTHLPADIRVFWVKKMPDDFHARFSAIAREYTYLLNIDPIKPALFHQHLAWHYKPLNLEAMQEAARYLIGKQDFSSFRGVTCQAKTPVRDLQDFIVYKKNNLFIFRVKSNAFLYHMVRNLVGSLIKVGEGEQPPEWIKTVLAAKDRTKAGPTAPAGGLYFLQAYYEDRFLLPEPRELSFCL